MFEQLKRGEALLWDPREWLKPTRMSLEWQEQKKQERQAVRATGSVKRFACTQDQSAAACPELCQLFLGKL